MAPREKAFGLGIVIVILAGIAAGALTGTLTPNARPRVFGGSIVLSTDAAPTVADLVTGRATLRLVKIGGAIGDDNDDASTTVVPAADGTTWLFDATTGRFNALGRDNVAIAPKPGRKFTTDAPYSRYALVPTDNGAFLLGAGSGKGTTFFVDKRTAQFGTPYGVSIPSPFVPLPRAASDTATWHDSLFVIERTGDGRVNSVDTFTPSGKPGSRKLDVRSVPADAGAVATVAASSTPVLISANPGRIDVLGDANGAHVPFAALDDAKEISAATGAPDGDVWFVLRSADGWKLGGVRVRTRTALGPFDIAGTDPRSRLAQPVVDGNVLYTVDKTTGRLFRIDVAKGRALPLRGDAVYPPNENDSRTLSSQLDGVTVLARVGRIIVNSAHSERAVLIPTDKDVTPIVVDKRYAPLVDPTAAQSPKVQTTNTKQSTQRKTAPKTETPVEQISTRTSQNCTQKPRKPQITSLVPDARSMVVSWAYPVLDPLDCVPTSYQVTAKPVGDFRGPAQPTRDTPSGQPQYTFTGLRPNHAYTFVVTAVINGKTTDSDPATRQTNLSGPDAPTNVHATVGEGGWNVSWGACSGDGCDIPADSWTVSWEPCDGGGPITGATDASLGPADTSYPLKLNPALLGRKLSFSVTAIGGNGTTRVAADGCAEAWQQPNANLLNVAINPVAQGDQTLTVTVNTGPQPGDDLVRSAGFSDAAFSIALDGDTRAGTSATYTGIAAGAQHNVSVTIQHHGLTSTVAKSFSGTVSWPALTATGTLTPNIDDPDTATLFVTVQGALTENVSAIAQFQCRRSNYTADGSLGIAPTGMSATWGAIDVSQVGKNCGLVLILTQGDGGKYASNQQSVTVALTNNITPEGQPNVVATWTPDPGDGHATLVISGTLPKGGQWSLAVCDQQITIARRRREADDITPVIVDFAGRDPSCVGASLSLTRVYGNDTTIPYDVSVVGTPPTTTTTTP